MSDQRCSDNGTAQRDIPSFIEPRPPLILNPFMRPRPQKGTNLLELFEEDAESDEPEWVKVYLRMKPYPVKNNLYEVRNDKCLITSTDTATMGHGRRTQHNVSKMYTFSHIFGPESSQKEIFEHVVKGNLKKLPEGQNFTLLTYGASGSGKTFTLMGTVQSPGLVPRSLEYVFKIVEAAQEPLFKPADGGADKLNYYDQDYELQFVKKLRQVSAPLREKYRRMSAQLCSDLTTSNFDLSNRTQYYVWVSFVEIYNESIYDLLSYSDRSKATSKLRIREDASGNAYVKGATQVFVRTGEEAYDVLVAGKHNLQVAATGVHAASSRSHCIFTITLLTHTDEGVRTSCVRLCDLAGCERARHTKNTGARMQESRSINSSLHVLERCLHMLRRKQKQKIDATLVPYRESKLTRLLGAGLSGSRHEAVSMVVTLTPAPLYQHETRHVLQLAAVAKDIQVNQTIAESTISSHDFTQDTTMEVNAEVMRLRAENERLHFELVQAHARNKELIAASEEKQQEVAKTMYEVMEEAKDMTRKYYQSQMEFLRTEMEEMREEYEKKLQAAEEPSSRQSDVGTPSRSLQKKIAALTTEIAILEEKLTAEKLARARAEEEVQHLRACIEERDEKTDEDSTESKEDVMSVTDESESETEDIYNESLEPTFKKDDINRSKMLQQSLMNDSKDHTDRTMDNIDDSKQDNTLNDVTDNRDTEIDKSNDTLKDNDSVDNNQDDTAKDSNYLSEEDDVTRKSSVANVNASIASEEKVDNKVDGKDEIQTEKHDRGTYVVTNEETSKVNERKSLIDQLKRNCVEMDRIGKSITKQIEEKSNASVVNKLDKSKHKLEATRSDVSLFQFEQLEKASKTDNTKTADPIDTFTNIKYLKGKHEFFDYDNNENDLIPKLNKDKTYFDNIDTYINSHKKIDEVKKILNDDRSPSIVKEDVTMNFEPNAIKKLLGESFTRQPDIITTVKKAAAPKKHVSVDIFEGFESPQVFNAKAFEEPNKVTSDKLSTLKDTSNELIKQADDDKMPLPNDINKVNLNIVKIEKPDTPKAKVSIFERCVEKVSICSKTVDDVEKTRKTIEHMILKDKNEPQNETSAIKIKQERISNGLQNIDPENEKQESEVLTNNTVEDFENIYKDITAPRATEFDLLVSETSIANNISADNNTEKPKYNLRHTKFNTSGNKDIKCNGTVNKNDVSLEKVAETKKQTNKKAINDKFDTSEEILLESKAKCESVAKPKRNLRLRRQKNTQTSEEDNDGKLKDIVNLQKEFSDVTLDVPVETKQVKDIESPEKSGEVENVPPLYAQSCPSKSVTRSRRKLFTPRAEPLEESLAQSGESNERVRVPRPSYHRTTRVRRKL